MILKHVSYNGPLYSILLMAFLYINMSSHTLIFFYAVLFFFLSQNAVLPFHYFFCFSADCWCQCIHEIAINLQPCTNISAKSPLKILNVKFSKYHWNEDVQNHIDLRYLCVVHVYNIILIVFIQYFFDSQYSQILFKYIMLVLDW